jgi:exosortase
VEPSEVSRRALAAAAIVAAAIILTYAGVVAGLVRQWQADENYSHGFIVAPLAAWFVWQRRARLYAETPRPSAAGLLVLAGSVGLLALGTLGAELFLTRVSLVGVLAGAVLFLLGWRHLRLLAFPLAFLLLMIPLPAIVFNQIAFPLQIFASQAGAATLDLAGVPVLREGNILELPETRLEVAEACSGIRSLVSLITLAIVLGQFSLGGRWTRAALVLAAVPVAIVANATRVAGTGLMAHFWSPEAAEGFFHAFSGWIVFGVAFAALLAVQRGLGALEDRRAPGGARVLAEA